jgi:hypothetical protein
MLDEGRARKPMIETCELLFSRSGELWPKVAQADDRGAFRFEWLAGANEVSITRSVTFFDLFPNTTICLWQCKAYGSGHFVREGDNLRLIR